MGQVTCDPSISADGYPAGHNQGEERPFGNGCGDRPHAWMFDNPEENRTEVEQMTDARAYVMGAEHVWPSTWRVGPAIEGLVG